MTVAPATVLVVEDNDEMRAFLCRQLADHYRVIEARNGDEGWQQVQESQPDLLLSDTEMPGPDGWTLGRRVKESTDVRSIPVILLEGGPGESQGAESSSAQDENGQPSPASREGGARQSIHSSPKADATDFRRENREQRTAASASRPEPEVDVVLQKPFVLDELQQHLERYLPTRGLPDYVDAAGDFLKEVVQTIERRLHDPDFTAGALADAMSLSRRHLTRRVKAAADTTPAALIRERRIERAKAHFEAGDTKVVDVCAAVGFRSASHFSQSFRKHEGCSPTTYIEQNGSRGGST